MTITSPPYNVGKAYGDLDDLLGEEAYLDLMLKTLKELHRVTRPGGRLALNVPFIGNSKWRQKSESCIFYPGIYLPLLDQSEWILREFIIWVKASREEDPESFSGNNTAWGSWLSPSCPYMRCYAEAILVCHKLSRFYGKRESDITKEEFLAYTKNVWFFPAESNRLHPAPFPEELPHRLIKLYTSPGDLILDPFIGSGTTAAAAKQLGRRFIGIDKVLEYVQMSRLRLAQERLF